MVLGIWYNIISTILGEIDFQVCSGTRTIKYDLITVDSTTVVISSFIIYLFSFVIPLARIIIVCV